MVGVATAIAAAVLLVLPSLALAVGALQIRDRAVNAWNMSCSVNAADITCIGPTSRIAEWTAAIAPASGQFTELHTNSRPFQGPPLDSGVGGSRDWMIDLHSFACGDAAGITKFVNAVGDLTKVPSSVPDEQHGVCLMSGSLEPNVNGAPVYHVLSVFNPPPTPTPSPTPKPTAPPTAAPTTKPTVAPTATPEPSSTPSAGASLGPSPTLASTPSPTPTGVVSPAEITPAPTASAPPGGGGGNGGSGSSFVDSIPDFDGVATDATSVAGSALLALLLLLIGFAAELFNNTVENNYDVFAALFKKGWVGRLNGWIARHARAGVLVFLVLTALVSSFVDPTFGPNLRSFFEFLGFLVGVVVVLASFKGPPMLAHRRKTGELGHLRPLPWALVIAAVFVLVSRVGNLQPGYLYGIVLGAIFTREVSDREEGRETIYGSIWTLFVSLAAWVGLTFVRGLGLPSDDPGGTFALTALGAILVSGLEATAFGLMPLRFMPGYAIYKWNRAFWAVLFGLSVFAFIHILIGPTSGYVSALNPAAFFAAGGAFAIFGAFSIATWAYFRFRPAPVAPDLER
jgi:hypothetical protein